ncbi:MAG: hypothetical protein WC121_02800 [Candidatus Kapaibacterium sp.]
MNKLQQYVLRTLESWRTQQGSSTSSQSKEITQISMVNYQSLRYVKEKLQVKYPEYDALFVPGDDTPINLVPFTKAENFNHIMLVKVVSADKVRDIDLIDDDNWVNALALSKYFKSQLFNDEYGEEVANKTMVFTTGYAKVQCPVISAGKHMLIDADIKHYFVKNLHEGESFDLLSKVTRRHRLNGI